MQGLEKFEKRDLPHNPASSLPSIAANERSRIRQLKRGTPGLYGSKDRIGSAAYRVDCSGHTRDAVILNIRILQIAESEMRLLKET